MRSELVLAENGVFRQRAVAHGVRSLIRGDVVHRDADPLVHILVVKDMMSVAVTESTRKLSSSPFLQFQHILSSKNICKFCFFLVV